MRSSRIIWAVCLVALLINYVFSGEYSGLYLLVGALFIPLASLLCTMLIPPGLQVRVEVADMCRKNQQLEGLLRIKSSSFFPIFKLKIDLKIRNVMTGEQQDEALETALNSRKDHTWPFVVDNRLCGIVRIEVGKAELYDLFGIWQKKIAIDASTHIKVIPDTFAMEPRIVPGLAADSDSIEYSTVKPGYDISEIFGIREYREGDNIKNIHWKLTSKCDDVMVKLPSLPLENSILLMLETGIGEGASDGAQTYHTQADGIRSSISMPSSIASQTSSQQADSIRTYSPQIYNAVAEIYITLSQSLIHNDIAHSIAWYDRSRSFLFEFDIESEGDLAGALDKILSCEHKTDAENAIDHYLHEKGSPQKAHLVYVSYEPAGGFSELAPDIYKTAIICSNEKTGSCAGVNSEISCTPQAYDRELQEIAI